MGVRVCVANFFLGQSIGIDVDRYFQLKFFSSTKIAGATGLVGLLALEWAWHNLNLKAQVSFFDSFRDIRVHI